MRTEPDVAGKRRILHVFRAPLGGLFRHVVDLAEEQSARGHEVGLYFDSAARGEHVGRALSRLSGRLALGVHGCPIDRNPSPRDALVQAHFNAKVAELKPDVVHGHGSKGGVYARLPGLFHPRSGPIRAYTPHGGSFNYRPGTFVNRAYMLAERVLARSTDVFLFESAFIAGRFDAAVGGGPYFRRIVANGLSEAEFQPVTPNADAADFLYIGELRQAKGIDTLLDALVLAGKSLGAIPRAVLVGSGPDKDLLLARAQSLGMADRVSFPGLLPAREAFKLGRILVVPSRAESLPYIVLEAAAAQLPLVSTNVGGIPEIFGPHAGWLGPPDDAENLCARMLEMLKASPAERIARGATLAAYVAEHFSIRTMVDSVMEGYGEAIARRAPMRAGAKLLSSPSRA